MNVEILKSFEKDVLKVKDKKVASQVFDAIESIENAQKVIDIPHLKKLSNAKNCFRVRIGDY